MKFAQVDPTSNIVLNIFDTEAFTYADLPPEGVRFNLTDKEYATFSSVPAIIINGKISEYIEPEPSEPDPVDPRERMEVTAFQAKAAIARSGLYDPVVELMHHPDTPLETKLAFEEVLTFKRLSPTVVTMGAALGLTDQQLDDLFSLAATIKA